MGTGEKPAMKNGDPFNMISMDRLDQVAAASIYRRSKVQSVLRFPTPAISQADDVVS
jgi:hypothetical protein